MRTDLFARPVTILTGPGFPRAVRSLTEAYQLLIDDPGFTRDAGYTFALKACQAALAGEIEVETARGLFVALAEKHDLLAPDLKAFTAFQRRRGNDPHPGD
ncbi:DUF982 domain-containing protein [Bosea psychrotolerans]|uniref:Uncharacterized protein DUF982 n=1 Tax=Bosea psychrotolerans TaxID=1871628 RepID=A0A2S4M102_9HYPH|nr:DUF982 domain-containing protein [Bosea psychrotolerans]POR48348.1 uncharacterized protein DUF982 [Bosea psychrotolerans]